jgi:phosphatidylinositol alpha 1,6-mannosyltransferase
MRIVYFTESLLPLVDGVSVTLARLFATLETRRIDFRVVSPFRPDTTIAWRNRVVVVPSIAFPPYPAYRVSLPLVRGLARRLSSWGPDLVHVVSPTPMAVWAQRHAARNGVPIVSSFHTDFVSYFRYYRIGLLEKAGWRYLRWFHSRCAATYAPSKRIAGELGAHRIGNVELWSRGVDTNRFSPAFRDAAIRELAGAADRPLLIFAGRLVKEKGLADLVEAHRLLRARGVAYALAVVGEGPMRRKLQSALPDACFAGHQEGEALSRWFASADLLVFPSTTETFGNVVLEAAASGVAAVVTDSGGPPELVRHGETGLVARSHDARDFAAKVQELVEDVQLLAGMGRRARDVAAGRNWEEVNSALIESYVRVVSASRKAAAR